METSSEATVETDRKPRVVSPFRFPPSLSAKHEEELRKRAISREFALASGVRTAADNELRELNFQASLPHEERSKGLQGICFPYVDLELKAEAAWRIKPDTTFTLSDGSHPKYLSRVGDKARALLPPHDHSRDAFRSQGERRHHGRRVQDSRDSGGPAEGGAETKVRGHRPPGGQWRMAQGKARRSDCRRRP